MALQVCNRANRRLTTQWNRVVLLQCSRHRQSSGVDWRQIHTCSRNHILIFWCDIPVDTCSGTGSDASQYKDHFRNHWTELNQPSLPGLTRSAKREPEVGSSRSGCCCRHRQQCRSTDGNSKHCFQPRKVTRWRHLFLISRPTLQSLETTRLPSKHQSCPNTEVQLMPFWRNHEEPHAYRHFRNFLSNARRFPDLSWLHGLFQTRCQRMSVNSRWLQVEGNWLMELKVLRPTRHKTDHFGDLLPG